MYVGSSPVAMNVEHSDVVMHVICEIQLYIRHNIVYETS